MVTSRLQGAKFGAGQWVKLIFRIQKSPLGGPIWVHLTYQTAFVDSAGKLQMRRDIYNLDSRTLAAIKSGRGGFEAPPERRREHEMVASTQRRSAPPAPVAPATRSGSMFQSMFYPAPAYGRPLPPPAICR
jgi:L,D-transpeptidase YcbB